MPEQVAIITGAGGAIGAATATRLARNGFTVLLTDVKEEAARDAAGKITAEGEKAHATAHDVTQRADWDRVMNEALELGSPYALVNNAGLLRDALLRKMTDDDWDTVVDVHLRGAFLGCSTALREFTRKDRAAKGGRIVSISSTSYLGTFGQGNYAAAKGGIVSMTRVAALEGARYGVTANAVAPGSVNTPLLRQTPADVLEQFRKRNPLQRFAEPDEIAALIAFLVSDDAGYITGQVMHIDGGDTAQV